MPVKSITNVNIPEVSESRMSIFMVTESASKTILYHQYDIGNANIPFSFWCSIVISILTINADHQLEDHKTKIHLNFDSNNYLKSVATCLQMMTYSKIVSTSLSIL